MEGGAEHVLFAAPGEVHELLGGCQAEVSDGEMEENFFNLGIGDHLVQALNALRRGRLEFDAEGKPLSHGEDTGRQEITQNPEHAYKFRSLTLRQLKDARTFFHNGSFSSVRDVVSYFNEGVAQDQRFAGRAKTLERREKFQALVAARARARARPTPTG